MSCAESLRARADVHLVQADVGDRDQVRSAAQEATRVFGKIHVLCNNAGIGGGGDTHDADFEQPGTRRYASIWAAS